jgi:hypothetical protein
MKRRWVIVGIAYMALIDASILVRTERNNRRLVRWAAGYRIRAERGDANLSIPFTTPTPHLTRSVLRASDFVQQAFTPIDSVLAS